MNPAIKTAIIFLFSIYYMNAQDLHFSNYRTVSNFFNPAQNGDFNGFVKIQAATRTQYDKTYQQGILGAQIIFNSPINKEHWIAAATNVLYDQSGTLKFGGRGGGLGLAYHLPIDKKRSSIFSIGISANSSLLAFNTDNYKSELTILGQQDKDKQELTDFKASTNSYNLGVTYKKILSKKASFQIGSAISHLNAPSFNILKSSMESKLGRRINLHANYRTALSNTFTLEPAMYISYSEKQSNTNLQILSEWKLNKNQKWQAITGLNSRVGESIDLIIGYKKDRLYFAGSFDYVYNGLNQPLNGTGAIELGAYYIFNRIYTPKQTPLIICPRL
jgi:type IX secretion system PorP/SprF family membrane protein